MVSGVRLQGKCKSFSDSEGQAMVQGDKDKLLEEGSPPAGEGMEVINMMQSDESQRLRNSAVKDLLLDLAISLNTGSIVLFFLCVT
ncbi:hypothetical protein Y1Q_0015241 [Alligator mississippiensis]|uniref:Uncharacterized protein n=1 Tax=Alligator mississippiensis TaxID=8496 RepID=A0A151NL33_ALLMI|nr:hypothetical protein Y1Q_0015241 [Alligator mississippiensis]